MVDLLRGMVFGGLKVKIGVDFAIVKSLSKFEIYRNMHIKFID